MKKIISFILALCLCISLSACGQGVQLDENEVVVGNGTEVVRKGDNVYENDGAKIYVNGDELYSVGNMKDSRLFALGQYLYVNTQEGAMQLKTDGSKIKKFGNGEVIGAKGKFIYYQSEDNKVGNMIVYKINMIDGSQRNLFQDTITEIKEIEEGVFYFKGSSGNEYINPINDENGYFYDEWLEKDAAEAATEDVTEATE